MIIGLNVIIQVHSAVCYNNTLTCYSEHEHLYYKISRSYSYLLVLKIQTKIFIHLLYHIGICCSCVSRLCIANFLYKKQILIIYLWLLLTITSLYHKKCCFTPICTFDVSGIVWRQQQNMLVEFTVWNLVFWSLRNMFFSFRYKASSNVANTLICTNYLKLFCAII